MKKLLFKGPVTTASGYGVHARQILRGLIASGIYDISIRALTWGNTSMLDDNHPLMQTINQMCVKHEIEKNQNPPAQYDVSVQVTIPNEFERLAKVNVGITAGIEVDVVSPEWVLKSNEMVDVLFVPSQHSKDVFEKSVFQGTDGSQLKLNKSAHLAPEGFDPRYFNTDDIEMTDYGWGTDFNFLFVGLGINMNTDGGRKNIANLVKWFCEAFKGDESVGLVLKTAVVNNSLMDFEMTKQCVRRLKEVSGCGEYPKIHLVHGRLTDEEMAALYKHPSIKAFCTLTHGEGFGLPLLEAAACGLPVMAAPWSGHVDFLNVPGEKRSFVELDYDMTDVPQADIWKGVIEPGTHWASVKEEDVKLKLKRVREHYDKPKEWADKLAVHVSEHFTEGRVMTSLVEDIVKFSEMANVNNPKTPEDLIRYVKGQFTEDDEGKKLLYTMPMSAGDVYVSSAVIDGLKAKHPDHKIFFATKVEYASIVDDNPNVHKVMQYVDWMTNVPLLEQMFDEVYTPNLNVQMMFSNWIHGGKGRKLVDEMANACNVELGEYFIETAKPAKQLPDRYIAFNPGSGKGQWEARNYLHWREVVDNLNRELGEYVKIVQVGMKGDPFYEGCDDFRGCTKDFKELAYVIEHAKAVVGIDSVTMHMAAGLGIDHVALFGSSYVTSTGPVCQRGKECRSRLIETKDRYGCNKACYKYQCEKNREHPCINEIDPREVFWNVIMLISGTAAADDADARYEEYNPKISGYTHVLNAESGGYPYIQSITSMLGFCDEVIVVDGGSDDGTLEKIEAIGDDRIQIHDRKWDWDEPGMDGAQKAYGRVMCSGEFLWQQDVDEVVHERDYDKIRALAKRFPKQVDLVHLPVVELWGDGETCRTDRHAWKWRLSRNNFRITHGIAKHARVMCEKTGKVYAKRGMSDGCEYVDIMTYDYIPHGGFWNEQFEQLRQTNPQEYGKLMNQVFDQLPSVYHYSWADVPRKIKNFKMFWDKCWTNLYREQEPEDRFSECSLDDEESIIHRADEMRKQGGEHGEAETFQLTQPGPVIMKEWLK